jgi:hypothetical protein
VRFRTTPFFPFIDDDDVMSGILSTIRIFWIAFEFRLAGSNDRLG